MVPNQAVQMVKLHCRLNSVKLRSFCARTETDTESLERGRAERQLWVCASEGDNHMYWQLHANGGVLMRTQFFWLYHLAHPASNSEHRNCNRCRTCGGGDGGSAGGRADMQD